MVQEYDSNSTQPLGNDGYNSSGGSCTLPSVSQTTEIIITNKNLKESGYRNYNLIIKLLYSYIEKNNILPLNLKNDCSGMITLKNGESFPIFYKLRGKCRCFSILKDDLELFNTFLYENMPNNRMTVPQNPICLDKEVPILRKYICQILKTKHEHSFHISKIIYDACVNGERVSHDKILMTINSDASKPELRLIAHCRLFNGMICYALEKESISKINEYFEIAPVQFLLPQKGEISLQRLNSIYKCQPKDKYEQFKDIQRIIVQQIEAKRKEEPFTTTFNISLSYNQRNEYMNVHVRKWRDDEIIYTLDRDSIDKLNNLMVGMPNLDFKNEIPITTLGLRIFNNKDINVSNYIFRILRKEINGYLKDKTEVSFRLESGEEITFFYRYLNKTMIIATSRQDKDKLLDFIKQEVCQKYKLSLGRQLRLSQDEVAVNTANLKKFFKVSEREARAKVKDFIKMYQCSFNPIRADIEYPLLLPDGTCQNIILSRRSNSIGTGIYAFNKKDIPLLQYYFGYIDKKRYEELMVLQDEKFIKQYEELFELNETLIKQDEELTKQFEELFEQNNELINQNGELLKQYEILTQNFQEFPRQDDELFRQYEEFLRQHEEFFKQYRAQCKRYKESVKQYIELTKQQGELFKRYKELISQHQKLIKKYEELAKQDFETTEQNEKALKWMKKLVSRHNELIRQHKLLIKQKEVLIKQYNELNKQYQELVERYRKIEIMSNEEIVKHENKLAQDIYYETFETTHNFIATYYGHNAKLKMATCIFDEKGFETLGGISTLVPMPLSNLYVTGSNLGHITIWYPDDEKLLRVQRWNYKLEPAMIRDIGVFKDKLIVLYDCGIKIFNNKEDSLEYYQFQELQFDMPPQCIATCSNELGQDIIYVYLPNKTIEVYKSERNSRFRLVEKINNLPIELNAQVKKIIPLNNNRLLMFLSKGEIYNLPLKENLSKDDVILVDNLNDKIKCISNLDNNLLFIVTQDGVGTLYRFNESFDTMDEESSVRLKFHKKNNRVKRVLLRDNVCYIYPTDKYGFNSDMLKLTFNDK